MKEMEGEFESLEETDCHAPVKVTRRLDDENPLRGRSKEAGEGRNRRRTSPVQKIRGDIASAKLIEDRFVQDEAVVKLAPIRVVDGAHERRHRSHSAERNQEEKKNLTKLAPSRSQHSYFSKASALSSPVMSSGRVSPTGERTLVLPELNLSKSASNASLASLGAGEPKFKEKTRKLRVSTRDSDAALARPKGSYSRSPSQAKLDELDDASSGSEGAVEIVLQRRDRRSASLSQSPSSPFYMPTSPHLTSRSPSPSQLSRSPSATHLSPSPSLSSLSSHSRTPSPSRMNAMLNSKMVRNQSQSSLGVAGKLSSQYDVEEVIVEETKSQYHAEDFSDVVIQQLIEQQRKSMTVLSRCYSGVDPFDDVQFV